MKAAKEIFKELGFEFKEETEIWENIFKEKQTIKHKLVYKCNPSIDYKYSWLDIEFDLLNQNIKFFQHSMSGINCIPPIGMDLWKAINKQISELNWKGSEK